MPSTDVRTSAASEHERVSLYGCSATEVARAYFLPLAKELIGPGNEAKQLALRVAIVGGWHQVPAKLEDQSGGRTESVKRLARIAKLASALHQEIGDLNPLYYGAVVSRLHDLPARFGVSQAALQEFAAAAAAAANGLRAQGPGRPTDPFTRRIVRQLLRLAEEAASRPVTISKGKDSNEGPRLTGPSGEFIRRCFEIIDPSLGDSSLVRHVRAGRRHLKEPGVFQEDRNSLEWAEFFALHGRVTPF